MEDFISGKDHHQELANNLNVTRQQAKRIGLGLFYGMGHERLADTLKIKDSEAVRIRDTFRERYETTFNYIK